MQSKVKKKNAITINGNSMDVLKKEKKCDAYSKEIEDRLVLLVNAA